MMTTFEWLRTCALAVAGVPWALSGVLLLAVVATAWIGLAARAAWLAEQRGCSPLLHGFWGLVLPFVYPLWLIGHPPASRLAAPAPAAPPVAAARKRLTLPSAAAAASPAPSPIPAAVVAGSVPAVGGGIAPAAAPLAAEYFLDLIRRGAVTPETPCLIECGEGIKYIVTGLIQVQAELVVANVRLPAAEQRMRLPYARMRQAGPA